MSNNYIEIDKDIVKIHKDGKVCTLTNPNSIKVLLDICHKNNLYFKSTKATIRNADKIIKTFDSYRANKNKRKKLNVFKNNIDTLKKSIKLKKLNPIEKTVLVTGLTTAIGLTGVVIGNSNNNINNKKDYNKYISLTNIEEYEEETIEEAIINIHDDSFKYDLNNEEKYIIQDNTIEETNTIELDEMLDIDSFHFSYEDKTNEENLSNAKRYEDIFKKYGKRYGVDPNLLMAMAAQENCGKHYENLNGRYATGIMQIERSANLGSTVSAYNFETQEIDKVKITQEAIEDLETNIQIGTIILRNRLEENNYNIPLALQSYNFGAGNMSKVINSCSENENIPKNDIKNNCTNPLWLNYRTVISVGDSKYIEHIFSFIPSDTVITNIDRDGNPHTLKIINDTVNTFQYN